MGMLYAANDDPLALYSGYAPVAGAGAVGSTTRRYLANLIDRAGVAQRLSHVLHTCCFEEDSQQRGFPITDQKAVILGKEDCA